MKHIKLVFSISLLALTAKNINAQNTFLDSSTYYSHKNPPTLSHGPNYKMYIKEVVKLDSFNNKGYFYTVKYNIKDKIFWPNRNLNYSYNLHVNSDSVFFSGHIYKTNNLKNSIDSFKVKNLLIYNFALKVGDSFKIENLASNFYKKFTVKKIENVLYNDGITRKKIYFKDSSTNDEITAVKGLGGSHYGILPFKLYKNLYDYERPILISICDKNKNTVLSDTNVFYSYYKLKNHCDEKEIRFYMDSVNSIKSTKFTPLLIYPNPIENKLYFDGIKLGNYKMYNSTGMLVMENQFKNYIEVSNLQKGIYVLVVVQNKTTYSGKFVKE